MFERSCLTRPTPARQDVPVLIAASARRTLRRIRSSMFVRAGELVSRQCLQKPRRNIVARPKLAKKSSLPVSGTLRL
jgi:hypothetical protein